MPTCRLLHPWNVTPAEAQGIQRRPPAEVRVEPLDIAAPETVAGADLSFDKGTDTVFAGVVVVRLPTMDQETGTLNHACS